jgi:hypothetical protein
MICMGPSTQGIGHYVRLPRMIVDSQIIVLDELQLSPLPQIQIRLRENILQTLVIHI